MYTFIKLELKIYKYILHNTLLYVCVYNYIIYIIKLFYYYYVIYKVYKNANYFILRHFMYQYKIENYIEPFNNNNVKRYMK